MQKKRLIPLILLMKGEFCYEYKQTSCDNNV